MAAKKSAIKDLGLKIKVARRFANNPNFPDLSIYTLSLSDADGREVGSLDAQGYCTADATPDEFANIGSANLSEPYRGKGLYPEMLKALRDAVKKDGCAGVVSYGEFREGGMSDRSWQKFAEQEPRVREDRGDYYLSALPKTGRIPLATARRALKSLGRKATACRITPEALREGMEVEREHRDVTRGGMFKTAKIAAAHLCEAGPRYYKELKKVERKLKRRK